MRYAEVSVNSPAAQRRTFSYTVPPGLNITVGQAIRVPFGEKVLQGIVIELTDYPAVEETREISSTIDPHPLLSPARIALARWLSKRYLSPLFDAVAPMLPPGFERRTVTFISPTDRETDDMRGAVAFIQAWLEERGRPREIGIFGISRGACAAGFGRFHRALIGRL